MADYLKGRCQGDVSYVEKGFVQNSEDEETCPHVSATLDSKSDENPMQQTCTSNKKDDTPR